MSSIKQLFRKAVSLNMIRVRYFSRKGVLPTIRHVYTKRILPSNQSITVSMNTAFDLAFRLSVDQTRRISKLRAYRFFREDKLMKICLSHPMIQEECLVIV